MAEYKRWQDEANILFKEVKEARIREDSMRKDFQTRISALEAFCHFLSEECSQKLHEANIKIAELERENNQFQQTQPKRVYRRSLRINSSSLEERECQRCHKMLTRDMIELDVCRYHLAAPIPWVKLDPGKSRKGFLWTCCFNDTEGCIYRANHLIL